MPREFTSVSNVGIAEHAEIEYAFLIPNSKFLITEIS
jgi:hypothetical protein